MRILSKAPRLGLTVQVELGIHHCLILCPTKSLLCQIKSLNEGLNILFLLTRKPGQADLRPRRRTIAARCRLLSHTRPTTYHDRSRSLGLMQTDL
jgi:hypothetical protein